MDAEGIRLNKFLSEAGVCSRREADRQIENGQVRINGKIATMGQRVFPTDVVEYKEKEIFTKPKPVLLLFNKPKGIVCTAEKREKNNIVDYIHYPTRLYPVGRLDKDSRGLILMTNQGDLVNKIMRGRYGHEKEYIVRVEKPVTSDFIEEMKKGVYLSELKVTTRPCQVEKLSKFTFRIILTQGLNRQIRRMCQEFGYHVRDLQRVRIMNLLVDGIKEGEYREIQPEEYEKLNQLLGE
ncbi:MAG: pseudouridine synthase [Lachnospiraceae bacterium]|nr:pseudouridine synthase [Lachnospiraceae bacterium]MDD6192787.1 pseudouridine synthase [Lachnospiraceae bacterium]